MRKLAVFVCLVGLLCAVQAAEERELTISNSRSCKITFSSMPDSTGLASSIVAFSEDVDRDNDPTSQNMSLIDERINDNVGSIEYLGADCELTVRLWTCKNLRGKSLDLVLTGKFGTIPLNNFWSRAVTSYEIFYNPE